jgi:hypothetical protein
MPMSKQSSRVRDQADEPSYAHQDQPATTGPMLSHAPDKRLRNTLILANIAVWLIIIAAIKWLVF